MRYNSNRFLRYALMALLLFAQQAAFTHAASHALDRTVALTQHSENPGKDLHGGLCDFHSSFSVVLGAVGSSAPQCLLVLNTAESIATWHVLQVSASTPTPASRGPPVSALS
jgi:hypothetical protein